MQMKAEIENGHLMIIPRRKTEEYALDCWFKENVNPCTGLTINHNMGYESYMPIKRKLSYKFWFWYYNTFRQFKKKVLFALK